MTVVSGRGMDRARELEAEARLEMALEEAGREVLRDRVAFRLEVNRRKARILKRQAFWRNLRRLFYGI
jgi:hypothetical protein